MKRAIFVLFVSVLACPALVFADLTVKQKVTVSGQGSETTRMIKGSRERSESKIVMEIKEGDPDISSFMPNVAKIIQCDEKKRVYLNDKQKLYFDEPLESEVETAKPAATRTKTRKGGTVVVTIGVKDTGERKEMFGLTARHLIVTQTLDASADSCIQKEFAKTVTDGWYADFSADFICPIDEPEMPPAKPDCLDRMIVKRTGGTRTGFLLLGEMSSYNAANKVVMTVTTETTEISRKSLLASLFMPGDDYQRADKLDDLYAIQMPTIDSLSAGGFPGVGGDKAANKKWVGVDFFSGQYSKVDQNEIRNKLTEALNAKGFAASVVVNANDIANGRFDYVLGVEIVSAKQSKAGKIGGLFGKVTGTQDGAKLGDSEVEVVVTVFQKDGKTAVEKFSAEQKMAGSTSDVAWAAIEGLLEKIASKMK
ncbi:MAG: hypothetical protein R2684_17545 [Pyrinomonadaceae bacterium]